jgi:hypothetical protein
MQALRQAFLQQKDERMRQVRLPEPEAQELQVAVEEPVHEEQEEIKAFILKKLKIK